MAEFNRKNKISLLVTAILALSYEVQGCHYGEGRKKREATVDMNERVFMRACLAEISSRSIDWEGPVDYTVIHSTWYEETAIACSAANSMDTAECWLQASNQLISANSDIINAVKECIIRYTFEMTSFNYTGSRFPSNESEDAENDVNCPFVSVTEFMTDFDVGFNEALDDQSDETVARLQAVLDVMQQDIICPTCECNELSENAGSLEEFDLDEGLTCNQCWQTRVSSLTRRTSQLARPFSRSSIRTCRLVEVDTCEGDYVDPDDPDLDNQLDIRVECLSNRIVVRIDRCTLVNLGIDLLDEFVLADRDVDLDDINSVVLEKCEPSFISATDRDDLMFAIQDNFDTCGALVTVNATHTTYTYTLRTDEDELFSGLANFIGDIRLQFSCSYLNTYNVSYETFLQPFIGLTSLELEEGRGEFDVELSVYRNDDFSKPYTIEDREVFIPDFVFVSVDVKGPLTNILLMVDRCILSDQVLSNATAQVDAITNQCQASDSRSFLFSNDLPLQFRFGFQAFIWVPAEKQQIHITCAVRVCQEKVDDECERMVCPPFVGRKRRGISGTADDLTMVSIGPIFVNERYATSCDKDNGGCSDICIPSSRDLNTCSCRDGYTLLPDKRNCIRSMDELKQEVAGTELENRKQEEVKRLKTEIISVEKMFYLSVLSFVIIISCMLVQRQKQVSKKLEIENPLAQAS